MILRQILAILALPFLVAVIIPGLILNSMKQFAVQNIGQIIFAAPFFVIGLVLFYKTVSLFATVGEGTLAPWDPPRKFVARGIYRHVRNPMISGVLAILLGEAILLGSLALFVWFVVFFLMNAIYIPLSEEPGLVQRFGNDYVEYKKNVPRWIPRMKPWHKENGRPQESPLQENK